MHPLGQHSVSLSFACSVIQQTSTAPSLTLGVMPLSAHGVAEFPFYR